MSFGMKLGVVLAVFRLMRQWRKKAISATIMTRGSMASTKRSNAPIPKARSAILPIVAPLQDDRSMTTTR
jgi:hypothetical protein